MGKRIVELDVTSGVLITKIIIAHMCGYLSLHFFLDDILFFCSPWLAFKAGMFFRMKDVWYKQIRRDVDRLVIPFFCFGLLGVLLVDILYFSGTVSTLPTLKGNVKSLLECGTFPNSHHLWYLMTLFLAKTMMNVLQGKVNPYLIAITCFLLATLLTFSNCHLPLYVYNTLDAMFFFVFGYTMKDSQFEKGVARAALVVLIVIILLKPTRLDIFQNQLIYGWYPLWYPYSLAGIICINNLARWLYSKIEFPNFMKFIPNSFSYVGRNSMFFYAAQGVLLKSGLYLGRYMKITNNTTMVIFMLSFLIGSYILLDNLLNKFPRFRRFIIGK